MPFIVADEERLSQEEFRGVIPAKGLVEKVP